MADHSQAIERYCRDHLHGSCHVDDKTRSRYATDMSLYRVVPQAVIRPADTEDVCRMVGFAAEHRVPLTARGGGSGTAGAALGAGIILLLDSRSGFTGIGKITQENDDVRVTAGSAVRHDRLQKKLSQAGLFLPSDPSSGPLSYLGGNIATRASGPHALRHGAIDRYLRSLRLVTASGDVVDTSRPDGIPQGLSNGLHAIRRKLLCDAENSARLREKQRIKSASGYNLGAFLSQAEPAHIITRLMAGSIGTLGIVTEATLSAEALDSRSALTVFYLENIADACRTVALCRERGATSIELIDARTVSLSRASGSAGFLPKGAYNLVVAESTGSSASEAAREVRAEVEGSGVARVHPTEVALSPDQIEQFWKLRKRLLFVVRNGLENHTAYSVVNDVAVAPERLEELVTAARDIFSRHNLPAAVYGHAGSGNLHLRPLFPNNHPDLRGLIKRVADDVYGAVLRLDGTVTGEHGMGRLRAPYLKAEWGENLWKAMKSIKELFDPQDILNPETMFAEDLRTELFDL